MIQSFREFLNEDYFDNDNKESVIKMKTVNESKKFEDLVKFTDHNNKVVDKQFVIDEMDEQFMFDLEEIAKKIASNRDFNLTDCLSDYERSIEGIYVLTNSGEIVGIELHFKRFKVKLGNIKKLTW